MKIWIENPFDNLPVEGFRAQRYWLMAEAFARAEHEVTLWTSDFNHTTKRKREVKGEGEGQGFELKLLKTLAYKKNVSFRRVISHIVYAVRWMMEGTRYLKDSAAGRGPDIIILSTPPICTGIVALYFKRKYGAKVVLDVMDLWPETFERVVPKWALWPMKKLAGFVRARADLVTSVAEAYPGETFYHGIEVARAEGSSIKTAQDGVKLVYIGNLGVTYDLEAVIEAARKIEGATLKIAGEGAQAQMIAEAAAKSEGKIEYLGYLGKEEMEKLLEESDIGIIPMAPESCVGVPYKFADYAKAGLAIVSSLGGESAALMKEYGAGEEYAPKMVESLVTAIEKLRPRLEEAKKSSRKLAEEKLDAKKIYDMYVDFVCALR